LTIFIEIKLKFKYFVTLTVYMETLEGLKRNRDIELFFNANDAGKCDQSSICIGRVVFDYNSGEITPEIYDNCDKECNNPNCYRNKNK